MDTIKSRRRFLATFIGSVPGIVFWRPGKSRSISKGAKDFIRKVELDQLKSSRPKRNPQIIRRTSGDETSLYRIVDGKEDLLCRMNLTGKKIWESCDGHHTYKEISETLQEHYQVRMPRARTDTLVFLELLKDIGAVTL